MAMRWWPPSFVIEPENGLIKMSYHCIFITILVMLAKRLGIRFRYLPECRTLLLVKRHLFMDPLMRGINQ